MILQKPHVYFYALKYTELSFIHMITWLLKGDTDGDGLLK